VACGSMKRKGNSYRCPRWVLGKIISMLSHRGDQFVEWSSRTDWKAERGQLGGGVRDDPAEEISKGGGPARPMPSGKIRD